MTETTATEFAGWVFTTADAAGWMVVTARAGGAPDLWCVRGVEVVAVWTKPERKKLTEPQQRWFDALFCTPVECAVWWPSQMTEAFARLTAKAQTASIG